MPSFGISRHLYCEPSSRYDWMFLGQLKESVEVHLVPEVEKGEVLIDQRGRKSLQGNGDVA